MGVRTCYGELAEEVVSIGGIEEVFYDVESWKFAADDGGHVLIIEFLEHARRLER